jgi:Y_Y_Y domain/Histidine kinase
VGTVAVDRPINKILVDSKNLVWVGTSQHGLYVVNPSNDQVVWHFQEKTAGFENLPEQGISSVLEYNDSLMLFTTSTFVLQFNRITRETTVLHSQETISGFIASLIKDREGNVWMGTTTGLYRFHPFKKVILSFNRQDGLFNDQFEGDAVAHLPDGQLVFGASSQLVVFDPVNVKTNSGVPQITITNIAINNKNLLVDSLLQLPEITLSPEENALTIDFSPLLFSNWHAIQYKMEGADKDWILADKNMQAVYTYLPPGEYRFYFRTIDTERNVSADQYQFTIVIHPPFYRAWWFYLLLLVMAGVLLFWFDQERMKRKEAVIQVRNKIADDLHKEVNTALQNINILSEMANIKAENDAQKAKEFITQIHQKSNTVIDSMEDVLWGLSPENDSMLKMVHRMEESVAHFNARYDTSIELLVNDMVKRLVLDMRIRYEVFLLFKESVQGLLTVCPEGFKFHITVNKNQLLYTVYGHNNPHTEIQLANLLQRPKLVQRVEAVGAEWTVQPGKIGFVFDIKIPLKG